MADPSLSDARLPAGMVALMKEATDRAIVAAGGRARAAALLGVSEGFLSKCVRDGYPELLSFKQMMRLEDASKVPIFASLFAERCGCHVVLLDGGPGDEAELNDGADSGAGGGAILGDIAALAKEAGEAVQSLAGLAARSTPAGARAALSELADIDRAVRETRGHLIQVASRCA